MTGSNIKYIAYGGASASSIIERSSYMNYFSDENKAEAYIIALGYNDMLGYKQPVGSLKDIKNKESNSVAYHYYSLIQKLLKLNPYARLFFVDMPKSPTMSKENQQLIKELRGLLKDFTTIIPHSYLIDIWKYGPVHNKKFIEKFYQDGHLNFQGYYLTGKIICSYIDYIIRKEKKTFLEQEYYEDITNNYKDLLN